MEDYRLTQTGQDVQDILNGAVMQAGLAAEKDRAELAEQALQGKIDDEEARAKGEEGTLQDNIDAEETRAKGAEKQNADDIDALEENVAALLQLIPSAASSENQLADKKFVTDSYDGLMQYVTEQIIANIPEFKGQFTTLAQLQEVADPKDGDIGIVRTKDTNGHDVFTFYQYKDGQWNEFYSLSYHPQRKPASTGLEGDAPYNGMGRIELPMNWVEGWPNDTWLYYPYNDIVYLMYYWNGQMYAVYNSGTGEGLGLDDNLVVKPVDYNIADIQEFVGERYLPFTESSGVWTITKPDDSTITSTELNNTNIYKVNDPTHLGINVLTQAMLNRPNTIYVIQYDFTLGVDITVPDNCILEFDGGSISNGNLTFNDTLLSGNVNFNNITPQGTIKNRTIYLEWFNSSNINYLNALIADNKIIIFEGGQRYICSNTLIIADKHNIRIDLNGSTVFDEVNTWEPLCSRQGGVFVINNSKDIEIFNGKIECTDEKQFFYDTYSSSFPCVTSLWIGDAQGVGHIIEDISIHDLKFVSNWAEKNIDTSDLPQSYLDYSQKSTQVRWSALGTLGIVRNSKFFNIEFNGNFDEAGGCFNNEQGDLGSSAFGNETPYNIEIYNIVAKNNKTTYSSVLRFAAPYNVKVENVKTIDCYTCLYFYSADGGNQYLSLNCSFKNIKALYTTAMPCIPVYATGKAIVTETKTLHQILIDNIEIKCLNPNLGSIYTDAFEIWNICGTVKIQNAFIEGFKIGIYCIQQDDFDESNLLLVNNCTFTDCQHAIKAINSSLDVRNCCIKDCLTNASSLYFENKTKLILDSCIFDNNEQLVEYINFDDTINTFVIVNNCIFKNNSVKCINDIRMLFLNNNIGNRVATQHVNGEAAFTNTPLLSVGNKLIRTDESSDTVMYGIDDRCFFNPNNLVYFYNTGDEVFVINNSSTDIEVRHLQFTGNDAVYNIFCPYGSNYSLKAHTTAKFIKVNGTNYKWMLLEMSNSVV